MQQAFNQFDSNIKAVKEMEVLYYHLTIELKLPNDLSDILRAQLVYAVSALDKLVHELVRIGMLQAFKGQRIKTSKFKTFSISLETYEKIQQTTNLRDDLQLELPEHFFEQEIIQKHKHLSFQEPDKIADALSFIWDEKHKWQEIALQINLPDNDIKKRLKSIVSRRNQIVHEADIDWQTKLRTDIEKEDVKEVIEFIYLLGQNIYKLTQK